ncbi:hypothetical protein PLICRDRAFT_54096 [Plicaturopsis crispa FD-325 SS-3]|nr:hypothetical protein PLICRDRAFT_54096 [Plicaturopsis crispa FD-325 SS-3]
MSNDRRIVPSGVADWLLRRGLQWPCFCPLSTGELCSARIIDVINTGETVVHCNHKPSRCGFYLNLSTIYVEGADDSHYWYIPTLRRSTEVPMHYKAHIAHFLASDLKTKVLAPSFPGYCGPHVSMFPAVRQMTGTPILPRAFSGLKVSRRTSAGAARQVNSSPYSRSSSKVSPTFLRTRKSISSIPLDLSPPSSPTTAVAARGNRRNVSLLASNAASSSQVAGPSQLSALAVPASIPSGLPGFKRLFQKLANPSDGVSEWDWEGAVEKCDGCGRFWMAGALRNHVSSCTGKN